MSCQNRQLSFEWKISVTLRYTLMSLRELKIGSTKIILISSGQRLPCTRIILIILNILFFEGYMYFKLYEIAPKKRFSLEPRNKLPKLQISQNETYLWLMCVFSCEIWKFFSRTPIRTFSDEILPNFLMNFVLISLEIRKKSKWHVGRNVLQWSFFGV